MTRAPQDPLQRAIDSHRRGDFAGAARLCREVLEGDAECFEALLLLGVLEQARGDAREAHRLLSRALDANPASAEALAVHGTVLRALQRHDEALASYDRALAIRPGLVDALYNRGRLLQDLERHAEALASYDRLLADAPHDVAALNNRGVALQALGRHQEALDSYARALALRPDYAEAHNNRGNALQSLGHHEHALAAFERALELRPGDAEALSNRGNALRSLGQAEGALASYEQALAADPACVEALNNRSVVLRALGRDAEALASCDRALAIRADYPEALRNRGHALQALGRHAEALACFARALDLSPDDAGALGMGNALQAMQRYAEALAAYDRALALRPESAQALNNRGNALQALDRHAEALECYARAIALRPQDPEAHWNEGLARLAMGDFESGWKKYEWRWRRAGSALPPLTRGKPAWTGDSDIAGKTLLLYAEQGFGDAIQFVRYAPMVAARGARVLVACQPALARLFATVAGVHAVVAHEQAEPEFDLHAALMSLPLAFGTRLETIPARIPYVAAEQAQVESWHRRLARSGKRLTIGLAWAGNPDFPAADAKRCPLALLAGLADIPGVALVSLQKGDAATQLAGSDRSTREIIDCTSELESFADTAALVGALDLVISVDTAAAHLAGALGKPVWILLPYAADWRWLRGRQDSPWYPTARLFRQPLAGDWPAVVADVAERLAKPR